MEMGLSEGLAILATATFLPIFQMCLPIRVILNAPLMEEDVVQAE